MGMRLHLRLQDQSVEGPFVHTASGAELLLEAN
eukprot:COSAG02_NODE_3625_length_6453_cov_4.201448_2_plen_33_part_00